MLYFALSVALLALTTSGEHERGQERVAASGSDALSGSALHSHHTVLHKHEHERKSVSLSQNDEGGAELHERGQAQEADQKHVRGSEMAAEEAELEASDSVGQFGCVWDNTGAGDAERMELNCDRLSEEECVAADNGNKDGRCVWKARSHEKGAHKDSITVADKEQAAAKKVAMAGAQYVQLDEDEGAEVAPLGCLWDATGCAHDMCDQAQMASRCDELSHSKASCLGAMGQERRCFWSHGSAEDARKGAVALKLMGFSVEVEAEAEAEEEQEVKVVADAGNRHSAQEQQQEMAAEDLSEEAVPQLGCMWDKSGCVDSMCDEDKMEARCAELSHSQASCLGAMGQDRRCFWSHGAANDEEFKHFKPEAEAEVKVVADAGSRHASEQEMAAEDVSVAEDAVPQLGCMWDKSGCAYGECDMEQMEARCSELSHSKASCLGSMGQDRRCVWSHGADDMEAGVLNGGFEGVLQDMKVSTMDILLGAAFIVTAAFALQRLYRWWADRGYIKLAEQPQDVEPLLMTQV